MISFWYKTVTPYEARGNWHKWRLPSQAKMEKSEMSPYAIKYKNPDPDIGVALIRRFSVQLTE